MLVQMEGKDFDIEPGLDCGLALSKIVNEKQGKNLIAAKARLREDGGEHELLLDLGAKVPENCVALEPVFLSSPEGLDILRHSTAHIMAAAVKYFFPDAKVAIGPAIENGFYYDFDLGGKSFSESDIAEIQKRMSLLARASLPFTREVVSKEKARQIFSEKGESYKLELLDSIPDDEVGLYTVGDFTDLCRGPHLPNSRYAQNFRILSIAGAYWRGDEKNRMLTRVYGTAFPDSKELKEWLDKREEARRRDHRKLGRELAYFHFEEELAPGMVFWLPKGMLCRIILEDFWRREHLKRGYQLVQGPQLLRIAAWKTSGHYDYYRENMYFTRISDDSEKAGVLPDCGCDASNEQDWHAIKPMNCIGHMLIYGRDLHSYRDLPLRFFELGIVHRHEKSGVLHGLFRVRQFTQDDAHIICEPEQLENEILGVIHLIRNLMELFDFNFKVKISTRPEKSIGTYAAWEHATNALRQAVLKAGLEYELNPGDGAFYGPKIDVVLLDSLDREWQCSTIQVDFTLPERFDLSYIGKDGEKHRPVMLHRAIMGSVERFIGILLEHFAGALPVWLAPEQARILTITSACDDAANRIKAELLRHGIRVEADLRNEKLGLKVREAQLARIPYILVVGEKEAQSGTVSPRLRGGENLGQKTVAEVVEMIQAAAAEPFKKGGMSYSFAQC